MGVAFAEDPEGIHRKVQQDVYKGPHGAGPSYQKEYRTSFQKAGGAFTTHGLTQGHIIGYSGSSRSSLVNWDAGASSTPGFGQN